MLNKESGRDMAAAVCVCGGDAQLGVGFECWVGCCKLSIVSLRHVVAEGGEAANHGGRRACASQRLKVPKVRKVQRRYAPRPCLKTPTSSDANTDAHLPRLCGLSIGPVPRTPTPTRLGACRRQRPPVAAEKHLEHGKMLRQRRQREEEWQELLPGDAQKRAAAGETERKGPDRYR